MLRWRLTPCRRAGSRAWMSSSPDPSTPFQRSPLSPPDLARGLYAIVDVTSLAARGLDPIAFTEAILAARPAALQVRAKALAPADFLGLLRAVGPACRAAAVPLIANDHVDLALLSGCDGVHVGQDDLAVERVREMAPGLRVGVSTHDLDQLGRALSSRPAYVAYGPVFATSSKARPDPSVGTDGLALASARAREAGVKLVAIGGVTLERAPELRRWAHASAVIHALLPSGPGRPYDEVTTRAKAFHAALGGGDDGAPVADA